MPVTNAVSHSKKPFLARLMSAFANPSAAMLAAEKARLEAFLTAFPGEYCGWARDGSVAYSAGFCRMFGLDHIRGVADLQARLPPTDSAALEGAIDRLRHGGQGFVLRVETHDGERRLKISGTRGHDLQQQEFYIVLWVEDETNPAQHDGAAITPAGIPFEAALGTLPRPIWIRDAQQKLVWCNTTYADFLNVSPQEVIAAQKELSAQAMKKKATAKDAAKEETPLGALLAARALQEGKPQESRVHVVHKGTRLLMRFSEVPLTPLPMTLGIAYNVTREEELETEMKRQQSSTRELLGQLHSAIAIYTADEKLEFYNSAFAQLWGLEEQWLNTRPRLADLMEKLRETRRLPEQADFRRFKQSWLDMFTRLIDPYEDMLHLPDGTALRMLAVPHSMGGVMMTFEDVTSRLALESSYNTLIAVQKETLDNLAESVAVYGGDGRLKLWNPAFSRLWKLNPEDLEGEPHVSRVVEKMRPFFDAEAWPRQREALIAKGLDRLMHEGRLTCGNGALIDFVTVPLPDGGVLITYSDVTDSVRVENALREKNAALEAAEQLKLDFLANVSYQLRTPLNAIMGFTEILQQEYFGPLNPRQKEYTRDMKEASTRLLDLINDILDLSTLEAGYMTLQREEIKIHAMMSSVFDLVNEWARKEKIEMALDCPKNIGSLHVDGRRLQQALINIIRNAITFTPSGGKITLRASRKKGALEISVADTGIGISQEDRARIFEPFERAQGGTKKTRQLRGGAGLGLSLVKSIVTLHGGSVTLDSEPGRGTTVTMTLPLIAEETDLVLPVGKT